MIKTKNFEQRIDECMIRLNILIKKFDKVSKQSAASRKNKEIIDKQSLSIKSLH
jgi:hypothetical protein